jgi:hypothetical protein
LSSCILNECAFDTSTPFTDTLPSTEKAAVIPTAFQTIRSDPVTAPPSLDDDRIGSGIRPPAAWAPIDMPLTKPVVVWSAAGREALRALRAEPKLLCPVRDRRRVQSLVTADLLK